jgi:hypothetical protein
MAEETVGSRSRGRRIVRLAVVLFIGLLTFACAEILFRWLLFSGISFMRPMRNPELYAPDISPDHFRLLSFLIAPCKPASDRYLGWIDHRKLINPETYRHAEDAAIGHRTPVLLYGDSLAQCADGDRCFQGFLNADADFRSRYYLINYGVRGYGVDQIYLLYEKTIEFYRAPIVIISMFDMDLERSMSGATWGLKPYFTLENKELRYHGDHLGSKVEDFFRDHPPAIVSYLYGLIVNSPIMPAKIASMLQSTDHLRARLLDLNTAIILRIAGDLKARNLRHFFLVLEGPRGIAKPPGWRMEFLVDLFKKNQIDYVLARDVLSAQGGTEAFDWRKYVISLENTHPNDSYNELVSRGIAAWIKESQAEH